MQFRTELVPGPFIYVVKTREVNSTDIFLPYSNLVRFRMVFIRSYPYPDTRSYIFMMSISVIDPYPDTRSYIFMMSISIIILSDTN